MLINIAIICLIQSTLAIFHHKAIPHTKIYVCLTPPNTMYKVQKHIMECQNEVESNIFNEAFNLIHATAFHHPHDTATIEYKNEHHDDYAHPNFTLTEQEILKFFENRDHKAKTVESHSEPNTAYEDLHPHIDEYSHQSHASQAIVHYPHFHDLQQSYLANIHKKTDAIQHTDKPDEDQRLLKVITAKRSPYTYFDIKTGTAAENQEQVHRSDVHTLDIHSDVNHHTDIHPTTASFKDKRIAGLLCGGFCVTTLVGKYALFKNVAKTLLNLAVLKNYSVNCISNKTPLNECLMHCLYEKDHAIDPHTGYPTLDGLVNFYSDGVHEHGFFMTTLRAVDSCLKGASYKYHINRHIKPDAGISCDLAFDIFDCVSDKITEYCSKHHYHDEYFHTGHYPPHSEHLPHNEHYGQFEDEYHDEEPYYYS